MKSGSKCRIRIGKPFPYGSEQGGLVAAFFSLNEFIIFIFMKFFHTFPSITGISASFIPNNDLYKQMTIAEIINDKSIKSKAKTEILCRLIMNGDLNCKQVVDFAETSKDISKANCIEALEFATKKNPRLLDENGFHFVSASLASKAPRVKWESAKVIGYTAHLYTSVIDEAIENLLANSKHEGTVVRWSAAFALGEILKLKSKHNKSLLPEIEKICNREEKNSIRKIYLDAVKKSG